MVRSCFYVGFISLLVISYCYMSEGEDGGIVIGIDLGTTYSCVAVMMDGQRVEIIPNEQGNRITPSYVAFTDEERLIGDAGKNQAALNPENTIFDAKRLIGRQFDDATVQKDIKYYPFSVVNKGGRPFIRATYLNKEKDFAPEEISAMVLQKMKQVAEDYIGKPVAGAVVTVPAYFNDAQRQATRDAGAIAGLNVRRILNEPTAAAIAYGLDKRDKDLNIIVYDLGGGTFDVSLLNIEDGVFEVLSTSGDTHLGGQDFDRNLIDWAVKQFKKKHRDCNPLADKKSMQKLRAAVETAKRTLSSQTQTTVEVESFCNGVTLSEKLTRAKFENLNIHLFKKTIKPVEAVLKDSGLKKLDIDDVVLVGGSTRIPKVQELLRDFFDGKELSRSINPDEAVAYGAALQAAVLGGHAGQTDIVVINVTPLTLGIETVGGIMTTVVERGTTVPARRSKIFTTYQDNQESVDLKVFEGERELTEHNRILGTFRLSEISRAPRGAPQIDVVFGVDVDGILHVTAEEKESGSKNEIRIDNDSGHLSQEEIDRLIREAEEYADADRAVKERVVLRNKLESVVYGVRNQLNDGLDEQLDEDQLEEIERTIDETIEWLDDNTDATYDELSEKYDEVEEILLPYSSAAGGAAGDDDEDDFS